MKVIAAAIAAFCCSLPVRAEEQVGKGSPAVDAPGGLASAAEKPAYPILLSGYAILTGAWTQSDPGVLAIGRNNGFALGDARIELTGRPTENLWLYLSLDGAAPIAGADPVQGRRGVELRDAYGVWAPGGHLRFQVMMRIFKIRDALSVIKGER